MSKIEFDLVKLKQLGDIDVRNAIKNFSSYEEYFFQLYKFVHESKYYLASYTADAIIRIDEERKAFRDDLKEIRGQLLSLGITYPIPTLSELDYEAQQNDKEALTGWINKFHTEIGRMASYVASSQIITEEDAPEEEAAPAVVEKPLILAADDKPELLTTVVNMLEDNFKVMAATSGRAVLKLIEKHPPELFLLDIEMPQMDGYELAVAIRNQKNFEKTPIIFLTSKNTREDVMLAIQRGGNDYLVKPVSKDLLLSKIFQHLPERK